MHADGGTVGAPGTNVGERGCGGGDTYGGGTAVGGDTISVPITVAAGGAPISVPGVAAVGDAPISVPSVAAAGGAPISIPGVGVREVWREFVFNFIQNGPLFRSFSDKF
jgi:hypothetical protein